MSKVKEIVKCSVENCERDAKSKGYCGRHYQSYNRYGDPLYVDNNGRAKKNVRPKLSYEESHKLIEGVEYKLCRHCEEFKPMNEENFYKKKVNKTDGFDTYCKPCSIQRSTEWQQSIDPERRREYFRKCDSSDRRKQIKREHNKKRKAEGKEKKWQQENPEKLKEYAKKRKDHKKHKISKKEWNACKNYFNNCCAYCGLPAEEHYVLYGGKLSKHDLHKEHVDHTGANDLSNCVPSCRDCNGQKWLFELSEWYNEDNANYTVERMYKIKQWLDEDHKQYIVEKKPRKPYTRKNVTKNT